MPKSDFVFGSFDTSTSAAYYKLQPINFPTPEKDVTTFEVPGRSGDLIVDYGSYKNVELTVEIAIDGAAVDSDFITLYDALRAAIMVQNGYQRLEDSLYPNEYRVARAVKCERDQSDTQSGKAVFTFDAKPQRYLTSGEEVALTLSALERTIVPTYSGSPSLLLNDETYNYYLNAYPTAGQYECMAVDLSSMGSDRIYVRLIYRGEFKGFDYVYPYIGRTNSPLKENTNTGIMYIENSEVWSGESVNHVVENPSYWTWGLFPMPTGIRFLDSQMTPIGAPITGTLEAPDNTLGYAPLIKVYVSSAISNALAITLNGKAIGLQTPELVGGKSLAEFYIDCELNNAYTIIDNVVYSLNPFVTLNDEYYFTGDISVVMDNAIDQIDIMPRWWKI